MRSALPSQLTRHAALTAGASLLAAPALAQTACQYGLPPGT
jgi:hypothetical protein